jgi:hypothetical protein
MSAEDCASKPTAPHLNFEGSLPALNPDMQRGEGYAQVIARLSDDDDDDDDDDTCGVQGHRDPAEFAFPILDLSTWISAPPPHETHVRFSLSRILSLYRPIGLEMPERSSRFEYLHQNPNFRHNVIVNRL